MSFKSIHDSVNVLVDKIVGNKSPAKPEQKVVEKCVNDSCDKEVCSDGECDLDDLLFKK